MELYIVKMVEVDDGELDGEVTQFKFGNYEHANESYELHQTFDDIKDLELIKYEKGVYTKIK